MVNKELGPIDRFFYKSPKEEDIASEGLFIAVRKSIIYAERKSSRLLSSTLALSGATLINLFNNPSDYKEFLSNIAVPVAMQAVAEVRSERTQNREINRLDSFPKETLEVLNKWIATEINYEGKY